ncbi:hypothetical protein BGZ97_008294 [Linnemannia gamsii]|uniref:Galactose oxidase n=1 Tax=Linnemannia gamsii TaxID=64522 RepID=A0A9P6QR92_9FUNG|nr:hypothetical protein BGZ97_008294 [Linnemannia gamsii]
MAYFAAYVTVDESTLYIQGGTNVATSAIAYNQFYSLDLTQSWNTSNPLWSEVTTAGPIPARLKTGFHSISFSQHSKTMMFWDMSNYPSYSVGLNLDTKIWEELPAPPPLSDPHNQIVCKAATDPTTNRVYIPGCSSNGTSMLMYDPSLKSSTALAMPSKGNDTIWSGYTFIWNDVRRRQPMENTAHKGTKEYQ